MQVERSLFWQKVVVNVRKQSGTELLQSGYARLFCSAIFSRHLATTAETIVSSYLFGCHILSDKRVA
jgi:hypothetical protein